MKLERIFIFSVAATALVSLRFAQSNGAEQKADDPSRKRRLE